MDVSDETRPSDHIRRHLIGGSDARIIMGSDEARSLRLWREKRGEIEPEDLSGNLIVQLGLATEDLNRRWYERNTGQVIKDVQRRVHHPVLAWMAATLDGMVEETGAVFEAKFMLPWSFSEESAAEKHMAQLQHNMWVIQSKTAVLSIITGGGKWVEITIHADPLYQHLLLTAEKKFWRCVESGERPRLFGVEPPRPRIEAVRIVDMSSSNSWAEFAAVFLPNPRRLPRARKGQGRAEEADAGGRQGSDRARHPGQALEVRRRQLRRLEIGGQPCTAPVNRSARLRPPSPRRRRELANPEKSLTATIRSPFPREGRPDLPLCAACRAALTSSARALASTRSRPCRRPRSTTTRADPAHHRARPRLGEWISSDWPVCPVSETAAPHRMGAALTYARRYALFTLVGIAGEDDLDAPDLPSRTAPADDLHSAAAPNGEGANAVAALTSGAGPRGRRAPRPILTTNDSAKTREQLATELASVASAEELVAWATRILPIKNALVLEDAVAIEQAFQNRLHFLQPPELDKQNEIGTIRTDQGSSAHRDSGEVGLAIPKTPIRRDKKHLSFVCSQPCLICGRTPSDAHHLRFAQPRALGRKVSDEFTVPLCRAHHWALHNSGDERSWWKDIQIEPLPIAQQLWGETR